VIYEIGANAITSCILAATYPFIFCIRNQKIINTAFFGTLIPLIFLQNRTLTFLVILVTLFLHSQLKRRKAIAYILPFSLCSILLLFLKKDSTLGRFFIWRNITQNLNNIPLFGYGQDSFKVYYSEWQKEFFLQNKTWSKFHFLADSPSYAFNEVLHYYVEYGIFSIIIFSSIILFNFILSNKITNRFTSSLFASNFCILLFAQVSYSLHSIWIISILICNHILIIGFFYKKITIAILSSFSVMCFCFLCYLQFMKAKEDWVNTVSLPIVARNEKYLNFKSADKILFTNQYFLKDYCNFLLNENDYNAALSVANSYRKYFDQYEYDMITAKSFLAKNRLDSSRHYFQECNLLIPNRFQPLKYLLNIALTLNDTANARIIAKQIITTPIKVNSNEIIKIKKDANIFLNN
jgi:O-antigen polymerase